MCVCNVLAVNAANQNTWGPLLGPPGRIPQQKRSAKPLQMACRVAYVLYLLALHLKCWGSYPARKTRE
eukprot:scaffold8221_cov17-Tisochrysis_lutea.AAC.1